MTYAFYTVSRIKGSIPIVRNMLKPLKSFNTYNQSLLEEFSFVYLLLLKVSYLNSLLYPLYGLDQITVLQFK